MYKKVLIIILVVLLAVAPFPRKRNARNLNIEDENYTVMMALRTAIMPFRKRESIVAKLQSIKADIVEIKPVLHIKYKNRVSRVKFRPQSARMAVDDVQYFYLKNTNICSIL